MPVPARERPEIGAGRGYLKGCRQLAPLQCADVPACIHDNLLLPMRSLPLACDHRKDIPVTSDMIGQKALLADHAFIIAHGDWRWLESSQIIPRFYANAAVGSPS